MGSRAFPDISAKLAEFASIASPGPEEIDEDELTICLVDLLAGRDIEHNLAYLAVNMKGETDREFIEANGAVQAVVSTMREAQTASIQSWSCTVLSNISFGSAERKVRMVGAGAIDAICAAMKQFILDKKVQLRGAVALRNINSKCPEAKKRMEQVRGVEVLITPMKRYPDDPELQHQCLAALTNVLEDSPGNRKLLVDVYESLRIIARMIGKHVESKSLCARGFAALAEAMVGLEAIAGKKFNGPGCVQGIIDALDKHRDNEEIALNGLRTIRYAAFDEEVRIELNNARAFPLIADIGRNLGLESKDIALQVLCALGNASLANPVNKTDIGKSDGLSVISEIFSKYENDIIIQTFACRAVRGICDQCKSSQRMAAVAKIPEKIVNAMRLYIDNFELQKQAVAAGFNCTFDMQCTKQFEQTQILIIIDEVRSKHSSSDPEFKEQLDVFEERVTNPEILGTFMTTTKTVQFENPKAPFTQSFTASNTTGRSKSSGKTLKKYNSLAREATMRDKDGDAVILKSSVSTATARNKASENNSKIEDTGLKSFIRGVSRTKSTKK